MVLSWIGFALLGVQEPAGIEFFEKKIRPVLVERCYACHSAQAEKLKGGLHLDTRAGMLKGGETRPAVVPGDPEKSLLIEAIRYKHGDLRMPPKGRLPDAVVADFEKWIRMGAPDPRSGDARASEPRKIDIEAGRRYWAFQPLARHEPPPVRDAAWCRTPIDRFILAKLEEKGLAPNPPVDRRKLVRRATFDLIGLPPAPEDIDGPEAYDRLIDRLLQSPHFGERWARHWLDVARFAESDGFEQDSNRDHAYHYRDFVIRAFNQDMPYDRFAQWQIAGDELAPDDPLAWMATGFLGAGAFPTQLTETEFEPARYDELDNMAATTGNAMLALTIGCARCHDHKFDPIPVRDYYRLASTFTTTIRNDIDVDLDPQAIRPALAKWEAEHAPLAAALEKFEKEELPGRFDAWAAGRPWEKPQPAWVILDLTETRSHGGATFRKLDDGSLLVSGVNPKNDKWTFTAHALPAGIVAVRLEALADASLPKGGPGRASNGNFALSDFRVGGVRPVSAKATFQQNATTLAAAAAIDKDKTTGWAVDPQFGKNHAVVFDLERPVGGGALTFDLEFSANVNHGIGRPRLSVATRPAALDGESVPQSVAGLLETLRAGGTPDAASRAAYRRLDPEWRNLNRAAQDHAARKPAPLLSKVMVTSEGLKPRKHLADDRGFPHFYKETHFLVRGDVKRKQEAATQGFLQVLMGAPEQRWQLPAARTSGRRAALARWMTDVESGAGALLARVIVNRLWQHHIGRGIVATPNDFGVQGERPTHPELLDWLALELIRNGWKLKPIHKLIMTSAVYGEGTQADPARAKVDPDNRLFWRRDLRRLEGEVIRDAMLAVGGALDPRMYGPGTLDEGSARRSVYFTTKRSALIPMMQLFDAPEALVSIGRRPSTTIAPQALLFMNNPHVRRYAAGFARRLAAGDPVVAAYRIALGRAPGEAEREGCAAFIERQTDSYRAAGKSDARELAVADFCQIVMGMNEFLYVE